MLTKAEARSLTREWLDDPSAKRWTDARIDFAIQMAIDDLWSDMLDIQSNLTSQLHTLTTLVSPGYIDLRLATQGGQLTQRFYRAQHVTRNGREYHVIDPREVVIASDGAIIAPDFSYYIVGDQLWMFPLDTQEPVELRYSFKPIPFTSMADGSGIPFPEGSESAYVLLASATTMAKGGAEGIDQLMVLADNARVRCLNAIRRQYHGMMVPFAPAVSGVDLGGT